MIPTVQDFLDATAFERSALATVGTIVGGRPSHTTLDIRQTPLRVETSEEDVFGDGARLNLIQELRPLLFGSAWKVLDLMIEWGLNQMDQQSQWTIGIKAARAANAAVVPLNGDADVWNRVALLYAGTVEARHSLVHRRFAFTQRGDMSRMTGRQGNPVPDLTVEEQDAFCRVARRCSVVVEVGKYTDRDRADVIAALDLLTAHHGLGPVGGGTTMRAPELIKIDAIPTATGWIVDIASALFAAQRVFPGRQYFDVEISFPGSGLAPMTGRLEDAPQRPDVSIDPANPPPWVET